MKLFPLQYHNEIGILRNMQPYGFLISSGALPRPIMPLADQSKVINHPGLSRTTEVPGTWNF